MAKFSWWLQSEGLEAADIDGSRVERFLVSFNATGRSRLTLRAMRPLLDWLCVEGLTRPEVEGPRGPFDELIDEYRHWLVADRALATATVGRYERTARRFLGERAEAAGLGTGVEGLSGKAVTGFLLVEAARGLASGTVQGRVAELRSLLRFLYLQGLTDTALGEAVPPVPGWKAVGVPPRISAADVTSLLETCDRDTSTGKRNFAMLVLLARLGLRASEVVGLDLGDIDWRAGELVVRGKARREDLMPLPGDVGDALASYLLNGRPRAVKSRAVFVTVVAPPRRLAPATLGGIVFRHCVKAGVAPVRAHGLRHGLATDLLERGASLAEIGQVLRHRDLATTAIYAKVDHAALRELALPWPVRG
jgi:site-specific recombinase XerD